MGDVTEQVTGSAARSSEVLVRVFRGEDLVEHQLGDNPEAVAEIVESWVARPPSAGGRIVVDPRPPDALVPLLRAIADAIEQERPLPMPDPSPQLRVQFVTDFSEARRPGGGELGLLWQEQAHPGD
jgi:hypothetical protein